MDTIICMCLVTLNRTEKILDRYEKLADLYEQLADACQNIIRINERINTVGRVERVMDIGLWLLLNGVHLADVYRRLRCWWGV